MQNQGNSTSLDHPDPREDLLNMAPTAIEGRLASLIRRYAHNPSGPLAQGVVRHIEALCHHPNLRDPVLFCAYRRLARHWRWIAARTNPSLGGC